MGCLRGLVWLLILFVGIAAASALFGVKPNTTQRLPTVETSASNVTAVTPQKPQRTYQDRLAEAATTLAKYDFTAGIDDLDSIQAALTMIDVFSTMAAEGAPPELAGERKKFIAALSAKQKAALPVLRDKYGPAMRDELWESDGKARTIGGGYRTVEFISAMFAANRNIKASHEAVYPDLMKLRFTRAQYKWLDADVEYSFYKLTPPGDGEVGTWYGGSFEPVR